MSFVPGPAQRPPKPVKGDAVAKALRSRKRSREREQPTYEQPTYSAPKPNA